MKNTNQLTALECIEFSNQLGAASYKTIDQFLFQRLGWDYKKVSFYNELKEMLEFMMERITINHPNGYTMYEWIDK